MIVAVLWTGEWLKGPKFFFDFSWAQIIFKTLSSLHRERDLSIEDTGGVWRDNYPWMLRKTNLQIWCANHRVTTVIYTRIWWNYGVKTWLTPTALRGEYQSTEARWTRKPRESPTGVKAYTPQRCISQFLSFILFTFYTLIWSFTIISGI